MKNISSQIQNEEDCLFCKIIRNEEPTDRVYENDDFVVIKNKYPDAPVHLLIFPKKHYVKHDTLRGKNTHIWEGFYKTVSEVVEKLDLWDKYQLLVNAPGMGHFHHEHMHLISGKDVLVK